MADVKSEISRTLYVKCRAFLTSISLHFVSACRTALTSTIIIDYVALFAKYVHTRNKTVELVLSSYINGWNPASFSQTSKLLPTVTLRNFNFLVDALGL